MSLTTIQALAIAEAELNATIDQALLNAEHLVLQDVRDNALPLAEAVTIIDDVHRYVHKTHNEFLMRLHAAADRLNLSGVGPVW